jgi:hypothetical protein
VLETVAFEKRVLLFSGRQSDLEGLINAKLFPQIIASSFKPLDALPGRDERDQEGVLEVHKDPSVWAVPLGGSGVLRLGSAATDVPPEIGELFAVKSNRTQDNAGLTLARVVPVSWLVKSDVPKPSPVDDIYRRYEEASKAVLKRSEANRAKDFKKSDFVGSQACLACHPTSVVQHGASKHATAFLTLKERKKDQDPECLACHVVGLDVKGGFVSESVSPNLAGVQCESCHGPRRTHIADQKIQAPKDGGWLCEECHNAQHSPNFNREDYWRKIKHGREVK